MTRLLAAGCRARARRLLPRRPSGGRCEAGRRLRANGTPVCGWSAARDGYFSSGRPRGDRGGDPGNAPRTCCSSGCRPRSRRSGASGTASGLNVPVIMGVGGSFDVLAGFVRRAPPGVQSAGLEWSWRLAMEPRKMWKRYLITNSEFLWLAGRAVAARRLGRGLAPQGSSDARRATGRTAGRAGPGPALPMSKRKGILVFMGTRPEAIKLAPVVAALRGSADFRCTVVATGQHREMFRQVAGPVRLRGGRRPRRDASEPDAGRAHGAADGGDRRLAGGGAPGHGAGAGRHDDRAGRRPGLLLPAHPHRARRGRAADRQHLVPLPRGGEPAARHPAGGAPLRPHRVGAGRRCCARASPTRPSRSPATPSSTRCSWRSRTQASEDARSQVARIDAELGLGGPPTGPRSPRPHHRPPPRELRRGHRADLRGHRHPGAALPGSPLRLPGAPQPQRPRPREPAPRGPSERAAHPPQGYRNFVALLVRVAAGAHRLRRACRRRRPPWASRCW